MNSKCVVRLRTTTWSDHKGIYQKKSITYLRRKSEGYSPLEEEVGTVDMDEIVSRVLNLYESEDGIYEVVTNYSRDWYTGHIDDWDYFLVPVNAEADK